ncbi:MAG: hypothetical protein ABJB49_09245 [Nitrospirota bacterium]
MQKLTATVLLGLLVTFTGASGEDTPASQLLLVAETQDIQQLLPKGTHLLHDPVAIEKFFEALDGAPPDWAQLHDSRGDRHEKRLFALNRERDLSRADRPALSQQITFIWEGVLSNYVSDKNGFGVAIGPEVIATRWGQVRFKPESLPTELLAVPLPDVKESLRARVARGDNVKVLVAMTGRLVPNEALIYDFAHEDPNQGMIMPMVRVEHIDYFLTVP